MSILLDIHDPNGIKIGDIPDIISATIVEELDVGGTFSLTVPLDSQEALALVRKQNEVRIYTILNGEVYEIGLGIIEKRSIHLSSASRVMTVSGTIVYKG